MVGFIDAAFQAQPGLPIGLALRGFAAILQEDSDANDEPHSVSGNLNLVGFIVRRQRRAARSAFSGEFHGLVYSMEQMFLSQISLHEIFWY